MSLNALRNRGKNLRKTEKERAEALRKSSVETRYKESIADMKGWGEAALTLGSGLGGSAVGGVAGIGNLLLGQGMDTAADTVKHWQDKLTVLPESEQGRENLATAADAMEVLPDAPGYAGDKTFEATGSPALAALTEAGYSLVEPVALAKGLKPAARAAVAVSEIPGQLAKNMEEATIEGLPRIKPPAQEAAAAAADAPQLALPNPEAARTRNALERQERWRLLREAEKTAGKKMLKGRFTGSPTHLQIDTPQKIQGVAKRYADRIEDALETLPPGYFYEEGRKQIARTADDPSLFAQVMGPTSTQVGPLQNTGYTVKAFDQKAMGEPTSVTLYPNSNRAKVDAVMAGEDPWKGYKVDRYSNDLGAADQATDPLGSMPPNDQWEGFGVGFRRKHVPSSPAQVAYTDLVRQRALDMVNRKRITAGKDPINLEQAQELHWAAIRARIDAIDTLNKKRKKEGKRQYSDDELQSMPWAKVRKLSGNVPITLKPADTVQGSMPQFAFQHSWEAEPGKKSGIQRQDMPPEEYMRDVADIISDERGKDRIVRAMGGQLQEPMVAGPGVFEGGVAPGRQSRSFVGATQSEGILPASRTRVDTTEAVRQYMLGQDARAGHHFSPTSAPGKTNAVEFRTGKVPSEAEALAIQGQLDARFGKDKAGVVFTPEGYRVMNFGDVPNPEFKKQAMEMGDDGIPGTADTIYGETPPGQATTDLLKTLEGPTYPRRGPAGTGIQQESVYPGPERLADSPQTREIAGELSDLYNKLEAEGKLTGSQTLSRALETWRQSGLPGLRELVSKGLAPAAVLALLSSYESPEQETPSGI